MPRLFSLLSLFCLPLFTTSHRSISNNQCTSLAKKFKYDRNVQIFHLDASNKKLIQKQRSRHRHTHSDCLVAHNLTLSYSAAKSFCLKTYSNARLLVPDRYEKLSVLLRTEHRFYWLALRKQAPLQQWYFDRAGCLREYVNFSSLSKQCKTKTWSGTHIVLDTQDSLNGQPTGLRFIRRNNPYEKHTVACEIVTPESNENQKKYCGIEARKCTQFETSHNQVAHVADACLVLEQRWLMKHQAALYCSDQYMELGGYLSALETEAKRMAVRHLITSSPDCNSSVWVGLERELHWNDNINRPLTHGWFFEDVCKNEFVSIPPAVMKELLTDSAQLTNEHQLGLFDTLVMNKYGQLSPSMNWHKFVCEIPLPNGKCVDASLATNHDDLDHAKLDLTTVVESGVAFRLQFNLSSMLLVSALLTHLFIY